MKKRVKNVVKRLGYLFLVVIVLTGSMPVSTVLATENDDGINVAEEDCSNESVDSVSTESMEEDTSIGDEYSDMQETESLTREVLEEQSEVITEDSSEVLTEEISEDETMIMPYVEDSVEEYILSDAESFSVITENIIVVSCQQDGQYQRKATIPVSLQGFNEISENDGKTLVAKISASADGIVSYTEQLEFTADGNQTFEMTVNKAGNYSVQIGVSGMIDQEGEYHSYTKKQSLNISISKQDVSLKQAANSIMLKYGDVLNVTEFVKNNLHEINQEYPGNLKFSIEDGASCFKIENNTIRAIGVPNENTTPKLKVWYEASDISDASEIIEIPIFVNQVAPQILISKPFNKDEANNNIAYIKESFAVEVKVKPSEDNANYIDLMSTDIWRIECEITDVESGEKTSFKENLSLSADGTYLYVNRSITVDKANFKNMSAGRKYSLTVNLLVEDADNAYNLSANDTKIVYDFELKPANAVVKLETDTIDNLSYRDDKDKTVKIGLALYLNGAVSNDKITNKEELQDIVYTVSTLDSDVAYIDSSVTYNAAEIAQLPIKIVGAGETTLTINARTKEDNKGVIYDIQGATIKISVANSPLKSEDCVVSYTGSEGTNDYSYDEWKAYLESCNNWVSDSVTLSMSTQALKYYDTICYKIDNSEAITKNKESVVLEDGHQYTFWMESSITGATTRYVENGTGSFLIKMDKEKPNGYRFSKSGSKYQEVENNGSKEWYYSDYFSLTGTYKDTGSDVKCIQYTVNGGNTWKNLTDNIKKETITDKNGNSINSYTFELKLFDGTYSGIAVRAIDYVGNKSQEYKVENNGEYIKVIVDSEQPSYVINVSVEEQEITQADLLKWTNKALTYTYEKSSKVDKVYYQYVPIGTVLSQEVPYSSKNWTVMPEEGFTVGNGETPENKNGIYYFKAVSKCGVESEVQQKVIKLQQTLPEKMDLNISENVDWYNAESTLPNITFPYSEYMESCVSKGLTYHAPITIYYQLSVNGVDKSSVAEILGQKSTTIGFLSDEAYLDYKNSNEYQVNKLTLSFKDEETNIVYNGKFSLKYWIKDAAGNKSEVSTYTFNIDTNGPENISVVLDNKTLTHAQNGTVIFDTFRNKTVCGTASAIDSLSGLETVKVLKIKTMDEDVQSAEFEDANEFSIEPCTRCFIYVLARDKAGNESTVITNGIIVDDENPVGIYSDSLILEPEGVNANGFFNSDVTVKVAVKDEPTEGNYSSLKEVSCTIGRSSSESETKTLYKKSAAALTEDDLKEQKTFEQTEIIVDAEKYESNFAFVNVTAKDYAGNTAYASQIVKIDITKPIVQIENKADNTQDDVYFNTNRSVRIHVTELNFDPNYVNIKATKNGTAYLVGELDWISEGNEHYADILFEEDGEYAFSVTCKDKAGNISDTVSEDSFIIDKTAPVGISFSHTGEEKVRAIVNDKISTWYFGNKFVVSAEYEDLGSGVAKLQYSIDCAHNWMDVPESNIIKTEVVTKEGKTVEHWAAEITFTDGIYPGIAVRAVDVAGNICQEDKVVDENDEYVVINIDSTKPECKIEVKQGSEIFDSTQWTNKAITYSYINCENIYKVYYQYVPAADYLTAMRNNTQAYSTKKWELMPVDGFTVGNAEIPQNKNGVYYFKAVSLNGIWSDVEVREVKIQQTMTNKMSLVIKNDRQGEWYNEETGTPEISFQYADYFASCVTKSKEYEAPITIHRVLTVEGVDTSILKFINSEQSVTIGFDTMEEYDSYLVSKTGHSKQGYQTKVDSLHVSFIQDNVIYDGMYTLKYWIEDAAGNKSEESEYTFNIDTTKPINIQAFIGDTVLEQAENGNIVYKIFSNSALSGSASAEDSLSGIDTVKILKTNKVENWENATGFEAGTEFTISPCTRCFLYIVAQDKAGNKDYILTNGIVVDDKAPVGQESTELIIEPAGANENGFFNSDVSVKIAVKDAPEDNYSSLKEIKCKIGRSDTENESKSLYSVSKTSLTESDIIEQKSYATEVCIDAAKYESNFAYIEVEAIDFAENVITSKQLIKIDTTKPEINIEFDNNVVKNSTYYNANRTATIYINELNFDADGVEVEVMKDGVTYAIAPLSWSSSESQHMATISFQEDGDYTMSVKCTDMAGNESEKVTVDLFTIDKTKPVVEVTYDVEESYKENFFNTSRIATITVTEHNFSVDEFEVEVTPYVALGNWSHNGDVHQVKMSFTDDGQYTFTCNYSDLAGNIMDAMKTEEFYIDTVSPIIEITGVENGSANAGEVIPIITVQEENYNQEEVKISIETGFGQAVSVTQSVAVIENGFAYTLVDLTSKEDNVYYLTASATDLAGNTTEMVYNFSLNRNGSTYDLSNMLHMTEKMYYKYEDVTDMKIIEMNVDRVEKFSIYVSKNGNILPAKQVAGRMDVKPDEICYQVLEQGDEKTGYRYEYMIFKENFEQEGVYNISFYSKDEAGNEVNNTLDEKGAEVRFVVDNTAPKVIIDGVEAGEVYATNAQDVNVMVTDNFMLKEAEFYLVNELGEELKHWNYLELVEEEGTVAKITIPEYDGKQSLLFRALDEAGNEIITLPDSEETPTGFLVSTNPFVQITSTPATSETKRLIIIIATCAVIVAGISVVCFNKKKKVNK